VLRGCGPRARRVFLGHQAVVRTKLVE
jgi:hypothetical protein